MTASTQVRPAQSTTTEAIGQAIRARREELGLTQARVSELAGIGVPQTISEIEKGRREVKAHELVQIARALHVEVDVLLGFRRAPIERRVLWRRGTQPDDRAREAQLLERARRYAQLEEWCGEPPAQPLPNLQFDPATANWSSVASLADQMRRLFDLGSIPAATLQRTLEDSFGVKVFVEPLEGSQAGACVRSEFGAAVLLNGADAPWRRNFSLAHELFHLVTWDAVEAAWDRGPRNEAGEPAWYGQLEKFANHFASHMLLPAETLLARVHGQSKDGRIGYHQLATIARDFEVSVQALLFRLCGLGLIERSTVDAAIESSELKQVSRELFSSLRRDEERWFPERFFKLAARAYQRGVIGKSVVAKFLEMPHSELETFDLGEPHGSEASLSLT